MSLVASPEYPVAGERVDLSEHWTDSSGPTQCDLTIELTAVPPRSGMELGLLGGLSDESARALMLRELQNQLDVGVIDDYEANREAKRHLTFDVPGEYSFSARYWNAIHRSQVDPSYEHDRANRLAGFTLQQVARVDTTITVGGLSSMRIESADGVGATLQLRIHDGVIRGVELTGATSEAARLAASQSSVVAALTALVDVTVATVGIALETSVLDLLANFNRHVVLLSGGVHATEDNTHRVLSSSPTSVQSSIAVVNALRSNMVGHMLTSTAAVTPWHDADDTENLPVAGPARDLASAQVLAADLRWRCYDRHRIEAPGVHDIPDTGTPSPAITALESAIVAYLDQIADLDPTTLATGESSSIADALDRYGFTVL